jgi:hypothetical protein
MGNYTELKINFHLKTDRPKEVIEILKYISEKDTELSYTPDPEFA